MSIDENNYSEESNPAFAPFSEVLEWALTDKKLYGAIICRVILESLRDIDSAISMIKKMKQYKQLKSLRITCLYALQVRCELHHMCVESGL